MHTDQIKLWLKKLLQNPIVVVMGYLIKSLYRFTLLLNRGLAKLIHLRFENGDKIGKTVGHFLILVTLAFYLASFVPYLGYPILFTACGLTGHAFFVYQGLEGDKPHGNAKFSNYWNLFKKGLVTLPVQKLPKGIFFGRRAGQAIVKRSDVDGHVLVMGGTGDGKSKTFAIPSLLNWDGSVLCIDIKGELYEATAHVKRKYGKVYRFDPTQSCDQYNPVIECKTARKAEDLARSLIPIPEKDPFFAKAAQGIFAAAVLEGYYTKKTLVEVAKRVNRTKLMELTEELTTSKYLGVADLASIGLDISENTAANVAAELRTHTKSFSAEPEYEKSISRSDWTAASLEENATIYLTIPEDSIEQYRSILNIILDQVISHMTRRAEKKEPPIMILIDELPRLGKINQLVPSLGTLRSRNVHLVNIIQSLANLDDIYGSTKKRVILDNCTYQLVLSTTDPDSQSYLSRRAGQRTIMTKNKSISYHDRKTDIRINESEEGVPLIRPEEFAMLGDNPVLFIKQMQPIRVTKSWYMNDVDMNYIYHTAEKLPDYTTKFDPPETINLGENVVPLKKRKTE